LIDIEFHRGLQHEHLTMVGAGRMAAIPPTSTFAEMADWWHVQVMRAKFDTHSRKGVDASLVMKFEILLVVKSNFFSHETGMEEWPPFH
jgi:hypothetical protein